MVTEMIVSLTGLAIMVGIGIIATFGVKALNAALPLLRTYVSQKQKAIESRAAEADTQIQGLQRRVSDLEREHQAMKEATAFMEKLLRAENPSVPSRPAPSEQAGARD